MMRSFLKVEAGAQKANLALLLPVSRRTSVLKIPIWSYATGFTVAAWLATFLSSLPIW